ncbi:hypothetical protein GMRT_14897 [Giardia muris]|uniref:Uncharacterized protein n=1 Tax=Giardia muris TaxID=5742 RepID=A0A4Z1SMS4_GIAMU|nr:hypothetical protein GMRT_14897 [Giardia muris]|eukprot:TNJ27004.1 hypothetical protein GMRT_14897 [Giardia muris]
MLRLRCIEAVDAFDIPLKQLDGKQYIKGLDGGSGRYVIQTNTACFPFYTGGIAAFVRLALRGTVMRLMLYGRADQSFVTLPVAQESLRQLAADRLGVGLSDNLPVDPGSLEQLRVSRRLPDYTATFFVTNQVSFTTLPPAIRTNLVSSLEDDPHYTYHFSGPEYAVLMPRPDGLEVRIHGLADPEHGESFCRQVLRHLQLGY